MATSKANQFVQEITSLPFNELNNSLEFRGLHVHQQALYSYHLV